MVKALNRMALGPGKSMLQRHTMCCEQLSPFGGLLPLIKFVDLVGFKEIFDSAYLRPQRHARPLFYGSVHFNATVYRI